MSGRVCRPATGRARRRVAGGDRSGGAGGHRGSVAGGDRGSATAELAAGLPALMLLLLFALGAVDSVIARMQCVDAARDAALAASRGGDGAAVGRDRAPRGATVSVSRDGDRVRVTVSVSVRPLGAHLPGIGVSGTAVADLEPADPGAGGPADPVGGTG
jgi:hypothetical protein